METFLSTLILGLLLSVLGVVNMTGNVVSLHWYHRHRVSEEDRKPFGKRVGIGTLLCGISCIFFGTMTLLGEKTEVAVLGIVGAAGMVTGIAVGLVLMFHAIIKYNKGLF
ncbi:MAG: hypothetical protein IJW30_02950 [Clostridia bacterium]|nr:hypothetical protein [Clostridia bacterium]